MIPEPFYHPKEKPYTQQSLHIPPPLPSPWQILIYFESFWICLFWTFSVYGITQYVAFCIWLLSLSMYSRLIYIVACSGLHSFVWLNNIPWYGIILHHILCIPSFTSWWTWVFPLLAVINNAAMNICVPVLYEQLFSVL